jgi:large subunit ribosomal protein L35
MPKMKTDSGAKKRIKVTGTGRLRPQGLPWPPAGEEDLRSHAPRLGEEAKVSPGQAKNIKKLMGL